MSTTEFYKEVLRRLDELNESANAIAEAIETTSPSHMDTMTGMSLIDVENLKADAFYKIVEALKNKK